MVTPGVFSDNVDEWSGDHCMDPEAVLGILFTSRRLQKPVTTIEELAPAILFEFGIHDFPTRR